MQIRSGTCDRPCKYGVSRGKGKTWGVQAKGRAGGTRLILWQRFDFLLCCLMWAENGAERARKSNERELSGEQAESAAHNPLNPNNWLIL